MKRNRKRLWPGLAVALVATSLVSGWAVSGGDGNPSKGTVVSDGKRPATGAQTLLRAGIAQGESHDFSRAARTFKRVLALDPENKLAWYNLGVIAEHDGRMADARTAYGRAVKIDPLFTSALFNDAVLLEAIDPEAAIKLLRRAIDTNPKASTAYLHLGLALAKQDRDSEAARAFRHAVRIDPALRPLVPRPFRQIIPSTDIDPDR